MVEDSIFFILKIAGERVSRVVDILLVLFDAVEKAAEKRFVEVFLTKCLESDCIRQIRGKPHVIHSPNTPYSATAKIDELMLSSIVPNDRNESLRKVQQFVENCKASESSRSGCMRHPGPP